MGDSSANSAATVRESDHPTPAYETKIEIGGGDIDLMIMPNVSVPNEAIVDWTRRAATAITNFYGRYPVKQVTIFISPADSGKIENGYEYGGIQIHIDLGPDAQPDDLVRDWTMTHEMFHLSQPSVGEDYSWMSEGMADYLEPVARVKLGQITPEKFWRDLVNGLPQGLPEAGDRGLDQTHTWASTYWGGCLYWFLADVRVRQATNNQKSVRDAAKAALDAGGDGSQVWSMGRLLATYDRGTGTKVFEQLHDETGNKPVQTDLGAMWKSLGVIYQNRQITYDDNAPLAYVRKAMTAP
jgi:hypothetical protein